MANVFIQKSVYANQAGRVLSVILVYVKSVNMVFALDRRFANVSMATKA